MASEQLDELRDLITRHSTAGTETSIPRVLVSSATGPAEPEASNTGTVLALIAQGTKRISIGDRTLEYREGQYLVASVDLPITGHYVDASPEEPALGFGLLLEPTEIAELLVASESGSTRTPATPPALGVADASPELIDAATRILRLLDRPDDLEILAPMLRREILWRLLQGPLGEAVRQIGTVNSGLNNISEAVRWISSHYAESFRVEDLARKCGMSTSAFHRSFQVATALSPIQFQKQIRLQKSRLMLISGAEDVGSVGFKVGYESASQFSREYRRQFGLPPSRDAARLRGG